MSNEEDVKAVECLPAKHRARRFLMVLVGVPLCLLLAGVIAVGVYAGYWHHELTVERAGLRAAGEPLTWQELLGKRRPIPADENGATYFEKAFGMMDSPAAHDLACMGRDGSEPGSRMSAPMFELAQNDLKELAEARKLMLEGAERKEAQYTVLPGHSQEALGHLLDGFRRAAGMCGTMAITGAQTSDSHTGALALQALLHADRALASEPSWHADLTTLAGGNIAWRAAECSLALGTFGPTDLQMLRAEFEQTRGSLPACMANGLRAERIEGAARLLDDAAQGTRALAWCLWRLLRRFPGSVSQQGYYYENMVSEFIAIENLPPGKRPAAIQEVAKKWAGMLAARKIGGICADLAYPAYCRGLREELDLAMQMEATSAALAAEEYRIANGHWPESLDELVPKYLPEIPDDVFSGGILLYKQTDTGVRIYSVGEDGKDNGGITADEVAQKHEPADYDITFRLLDPKLRGAKTLSFRDEEMDCQVPPSDFAAIGLTRQKLIELGLTQDDQDELER